MDDKYFFKLKQIQLELEYLAAESEKSKNGIIETEDKRKMCRILLADIFNNTKKLQSKMGTDFIPEFSND